MSLCEIFFFFPHTPGPCLLRPDLPTPLLPSRLPRFCSATHARHKTHLLPRLARHLAALSQTTRSHCALLRSDALRHKCSAPVAAIFQEVVRCAGDDYTGESDTGYSGAHNGDDELEG